VGQDWAGQPAVQPEGWGIMAGVSLSQENRENRPLRRSEWFPFTIIKVSRGPQDFVLSKGHFLLYAK
jgi:hypothetical protein